LGSPQESESMSIADVLVRIRSKRWPKGKVPSGRSEPAT
jgi:hypothetical protein